MTPFVLIHGGTFDGRCWDLLVSHLDAPALAVDLPGRGKHPMPSDEVDLQACADAVVADIEEAGYDEVVLVGHSMAGITMPGVIGRLGSRVRHAAFVACTVPPDGATILDTLDPSIRELAASPPSEPTLPTPEVAALVLGDDLTDDQLRWCSDRMVPEAVHLISERVDLSPMRTSGVPRTWIRTLGDRILAPAKQLEFAATVGDCPVVDLDCGHMCMVGQPEALAALLNPLAA